MYSNQRTPKVTHPSLVSDDDDNIFGSAEDYEEDGDLSPNIYLRPTKTSSDAFGTNANGNNNNNHHHYPYQNSHGNGNNNNNNNNARFNKNIPLFGAGSNGAAGSVGTGINGNALNGNNAIVTRTGSSDNEVSNAAASTAIITAFDGKHAKYYAMLFDHHFVVFTFNLLISVFVCLLAS